MGWGAAHPKPPGRSPPPKLRGHGRKAISRAIGDRRLFCDVLAGVWERFNWTIHGYCLMTNHYHLLVETPDGNLAKGMRELDGLYTQRF